MQAPAFAAASHVPRLISLHRMESLRCRQLDVASTYVQRSQILDMLIRVSGAKPKRVTLAEAIKASLHYPGQRVAYPAP